MKDLKNLTHVHLTAKMFVQDSVFLIIVNFGLTRSTLNET